MERLFKHFDTEALHEHFAGDEEMIKELVEVFADSYEDILHALKTAQSNHNFSEFELAAHTLKGMVANFFAKDIKDLCQKLEVMGIEQNVKDSTDIVMKIELDIKELIEELRGI